MAATVSATGLRILRLLADGHTLTTRHTTPDGPITRAYASITIPDSAPVFSTFPVSTVRTLARENLITPRGEPTPCNAVYHTTYELTAAGRIVAEAKAVAKASK